ncbi:hypothetical protein [Streptomyces erythrochromogenes]|uniref:hypothetical protein n=1 Tax=Streptomyces erythrochromogenes TaxID=285574 RepID=UPI0036974296
MHPWPAQLLLNASGASIRTWRDRRVRRREDERVKRVGQRRLHAAGQGLGPVVTRCAAMTVES